MSSKSVNYQSLNQVSQEDWAEIGNYFHISAVEAKKICEENIPEIQIEEVSVNQGERQDRIEPAKTVPKSSVVSDSLPPKRDDIGLSPEINIFDLVAGKIIIEGYADSLYDFDLRLVTQLKLLGITLDNREYRLNPQNSFIEYTWGVRVLNLRLGVGLRSSDDGRKQIYIRGSVKYIFNEKQFDFTLVTIGEGGGRGTEFIQSVTPGTTVVLSCQGKGSEPTRFLNGVTGNGSVNLVDSTDPPFSGTLWEVIDGDNGSVILKCLGKGSEPTRFLNGVTGNGSVNLVDSTDPSFSGTRWLAISPKA
jgi:hypothetical protein